MTPPPSLPPLTGIKVLELSRLLPGGLAAQMLGDMGSDVVKIEQPGLGDYWRGFSPKVGEFSAHFLMGNRNKRSIELDLKDQNDVELFLELALDADVVIEGFRPGVADRLGVGYAAVSKINPRVVYCSISGYGQSGPYAHRPGHDINYCATSGLLSMTASDGHGPTTTTPLIADLAGGSLNAVIGILAALYERTRSGHGQFIDVSMLDGAINLLHSHLPRELYEGVQPDRSNDKVLGAQPAYDIYECACGGHIALGVFEDKFWDSLKGALEVDDLGDEPFPTDIGQVKKIREQLTNAFQTRSAAEWIELLSPHDIPISKVNSLADMMTDPQVQAREMIFELSVPGVGMVTQIGFPIKFGRTPASYRSAPPTLGADNSILKRPR